MHACGCRVAAAICFSSDSEPPGCCLRGALPAHASAAGNCAARCTPALHTRPAVAAAIAAATRPAQLLQLPPAACCGGCTWHFYGRGSCTARHVTHDTLPAGYFGHKISPNAACSCRPRALLSARPVCCGDACCAPRISIQQNPSSTAACSANRTPTLSAADSSAVSVCPEPYTSFITWSRILGPSSL